MKLQRDVEGLRARHGFAQHAVNQMLRERCSNQLRCANDARRLDPVPQVLQLRLRHLNGGVGRLRKCAQGLRKSRQSFARKFGRVSHLLNFTRMKSWRIQRRDILGRVAESVATCNPETVFQLRPLQEESIESILIHHNMHGCRIFLTRARVGPQCFGDDSTMPRLRLMAGGKHRSVGQL